MSEQDLARELARARENAIYWKRSYEACRKDYMTACAERDEARAVAVEMERRVRALEGHSYRATSPPDAPSDPGDFKPTFLDRIAALETRMIVVERALKLVP